MFLTRLRGKYIAIEGVIGVGKTTLARLLSQKYVVPTVLEVVEDNPFLSDFYKDIDKWGFQTQLFFLMSRFDQQATVTKALNQGTGVVSDYTFEKDHLFAGLILKGRQLRLYEKVYNILSEQVPSPDLVVYLYAPLNILQKRIAARDRPFERNMDNNYLAVLIEAYERHFLENSSSKVLRIDTTAIDFVSEPDDLRSILNRIEDALR
ncbi:MAG TPA: deoxynucleoside kinase [Kosmotogaceae bacterium]|nr:MAG: Deoxynucleoside kinase [Thermotogales bacterium 46_20]HAA85428.1 deoxynucleoside kinase [Kosmotogaceae bacterium]